MCTWNHTQLLKQAQRFLNLKKCSRTGLEGFRIWLKEPRSKLQQENPQKILKCQNQGQEALLKREEVHNTGLDIQGKKHWIQSIWYHDQIRVWWHQVPLNISILTTTTVRRIQGAMQTADNELQSIALNLATSNHTEQTSLSTGSWKYPPKRWLAGKVCASVSWSVMFTRVPITKGLVISHRGQVNKMITKLAINDTTLMSCLQKPYCKWWWGC